MCIFPSSVDSFVTHQSSRLGLISLLIYDGVPNKRLMNHERGDVPVIITLNYYCVPLLSRLMRFLVRDWCVWLMNHERGDVPVIMCAVTIETHASSRIFSSRTFFWVSTPAPHLSFQCDRFWASHESRTRRCTSNNYYRVPLLSRLMRFLVRDWCVCSRLGRTKYYEHRLKSVPFYSTEHTHRFFWITSWLRLVGSLEL